MLACTSGSFSANGPLSIPSARWWYFEAVVQDKVGNVYTLSASRFNLLPFEGQKIIPAESVYGVFEAKQTLNAELVRYAREKCASVRKLHRTSLPIPPGGTYDAKPLTPILGGVLSFESDWKPPLGDALPTLHSWSHSGTSTSSCCKGSNWSMG
jgi:hypothetical protein